MNAVGELVDLLALEPLDSDLFRGRPTPTRRPRVFGGQVAAQSLTAAIRTVDPIFAVHSLHSYFLLPGDPARPIVYDVERIRDGRSFATRRVAARQGGRHIYYLTASFHRDESGFEHQDSMPRVAPPEQGTPLVDLMTSRGDPDAGSFAREWEALELRWLDPPGDETPARGRPQARMWLRTVERLPDDPAVHAAVFTFASDSSLLGVSLTPHGVAPHETQLASLDHAIWFHRPFRADEWWLYDQRSPRAHGGRGFATAQVFTAAGELAATVAQEGIIRPLRG